jgi:uncharacterized protein (DUF427 family)
MKAPGHRNHPDHQVREKRHDGRVTVEVAGEVVADSGAVLELDEDGYPPRYYFPRSDVRMDKLLRSAKTSVCPFKGTASYFNIQVGSRTLNDAVWTYEDPYEEHAALKDRLAFWNEKSPDIAIRCS